MFKLSIYDVEDKPIGQGGMGTVYRGYDQLGHKVAIKEMRPELMVDSDLCRRFKREIDILSKLDNKNIVNMLASFEENNRLYIVMEFLDGITLQEYVRTRGPMKEQEAIACMCQILDGLTDVHKRGFVHRDIKPSNIMLCNDGTVKLLDFGIAKDLNGQGTIGELVIGTSGYMSPEQAEGYSINHLSDIYSLGCVLYYMLVGEHAVQEQSNNNATMIAVIKTVIPQVKMKRPDVSDRINNVVAKALDKNMQHRFRSCGEFKRALTGLSDVDIHVGSGNFESFTVSIGRSGCDININDPANRVSRHHADVTWNPAITGPNYRYIDCSTNGSKVNGSDVHNSSYSFYGYDKVDIMLAGSVRLDWQEVVAALNRKKNQGVMKDPGSGKKDWESGTYTIADQLPMLMSILSFLVPFVGWIIYFNDKYRYPVRAKNANLLACIGIVTWVIMILLII